VLTGPSSEQVEFASQPHSIFL